MNQARFFRLLACLLALALFSLTFAGGLAGCGKKSTPNGEENGDQDGQGDTDATGPSGIAFTRGGGIFIVNPDGSGERRVTTREGGYQNLAFSPSGRKLAATLSEGDALPQLAIIDVKSGDVTDFSWTNPDYSGAWRTAGVEPWFGGISWAGEDLLYCTASDTGVSGYGEPQVVKFDLKKKQVEVVQKDSKSPSVSPDGKSLAYIRKPADWEELQGGRWDVDSYGDLVIQNLANGSTSTVYVHHQDKPANDPAWSRGYIFEVAYSPDGKHFMTCCFDEPDTELYYTDLEGKIVAAPAMVGTVGRLGHPSFSPDGSKIAYHSETWMGGYDSRHEYRVFTATANASMSPPTQFDLGSGAYPAWGPAGTGSGGGPSSTTGSSI